MCISTTEALHILKLLINEDIDACCEASMDKSEVSIKLQKLEKYLKKVNSKENPIDLHSQLDGYY